MSVRPTLTNIIGVNLTQKDMKRFKEMIQEYGDMTIAELLKNAPVLSREKEFPIPLDTLGMTLEEVAFSKENETVVGFTPLYHLEKATLHDNQLVWSLLEAGLLPKDGFVQTIPYDDYHYAIGVPMRELLTLSSSMRMELKHYEGNWARKYSYSPLHYFDEEFDLAYALFEKIGIAVKPEEIQRYVIMYWG